MYFTDDSLFPENMQPTIITAAPFGPEWLKGDVEDLPMTWEQQVQAAVDCYNAGATMLHVHVRDPKTGEGSSNFDQYNVRVPCIIVLVFTGIIQIEHVHIGYTLADKNHILACIGNLANRKRHQQGNQCGNQTFLY